MKTNWRKPLSFLLALCLILGLCPTLAVPAQAAGADDFKIVGTTLEKYTGTGGDVTIPDGVTSIGRNCFMNCTGLTSVTLPEGLTALPDYCFWGCTGLKTVALPEGITELGYGCFLECEGLTSITLPASLRTIGTACFKQTGLTSVTLPEGVETLGSDCFSSCYSLAEVVLPDSLTSMGSDCFSICSSLRSVTLPKGITAVPSSCFQTCSSLTSVTLPEGLTEIGRYAFSYCTSLAGINIPDTVKTLGNNAFEKTALTGIELPKDLTSLGSRCFYESKSLTDVTLPEGLETIGEFCFLTTNVTKLTIPASVTRLETQSSLSPKEITFAAKDLSGLTAYNIPSDVAVYVQAGTARPDWLAKAQVYEIGEERPQYALEVSGSKDGQFDLGAVTITNGSVNGSPHFVISSLGTGTLSGLKVQTSGRYAATSTPPETLPSGDSHRVEFYPKSDLKTGSYTEKVTITANGLTPVAVDIKFTVTATTCLSVEPKTLDFGTVDENYTQPAAKTVTIKNTGDHAVNLETYDVWGSKFESFTCSGLGTLAVGQSTTVTIQPKAGLAVGEYKESLGLKCAQHSGVFPVELNFTVKGKPVISVEPAELDFGQVKTAYTVVEKTVTIKNTGTAPAIIKPTKLSAPSFRFTLTIAEPGLRVEPGKSVEVKIEPMSLMAVGNHTGTLDIEADDGSKFSIPIKLAVTGDSCLVADPKKLDFGEPSEGYTQPAAQTVTLKNTGKDTLTLQAPTCTNYILGALSRTTLKAGETATFTVQPEAGLKEGGYSTFIVAKTEQDENEVISLLFQVRKKASAISVSPASLDFGAVKEKYTQPDAKTITVTNSSKDPVTLQTPASANYVLGALSRTTLAAGEKAAFTVQPKAELKAGSYPEQITFKTTQGDSAAVNVSFTVKAENVLTADPSSLDFGAVKEKYTQPDAKTITVTNSSKDPVTLQTPASANYVLGALSRTTLSAGEKATFTVRPKAELKAGSYPEQIIIKTAQGDSATVAVSFKVEKKGPAFTDVKESDWFYEDVEYAYEHGLMNGVGNDRFDPNGTTTRAQIVTILYRLEGEPTVSGRSTFADVPSGQYYTNAVKWASDHQIVNGYSSVSFGPNNPITREQMAAILYRYASYKHYNVSARANLSKFTDNGAVSSYAVDAISWANSQGLINGVTTTTLVPQGSAIRAQAAAILHRFCENIA